MAEVRYRGESAQVMASALLAVVVFARTSADVFSFGPTGLLAMEQEGLLVSGADVRGVCAVLDRLPGLVRWNQ